MVDYGHELYSEYSKKFFKFLSKYNSEIEQTSIDEGYMDVTKLTLEVNRHPLDLAKEIQTRSLKELSLPLSIGIAPTLYLAKMASDLKKPLGITILRIKDITINLINISIDLPIKPSSIILPVNIDGYISKTDERIIKPKVRNNWNLYGQR